MDITHKDYVADGTENIIKQKMGARYNNSTTGRHFHRINVDQDNTDAVVSIFKKLDINKLSSADGDDNLMSQEQVPQKEKKAPENQKKGEGQQDQPEPAPKKI